MSASFVLLLIVMVVFGGAIAVASLFDRRRARSNLRSRLRPPRWRRRR